MKELYQSIDYQIPLPPVSEDYGYQWPKRHDQISKELMGFRYNGSKKGFKTRFEHAMNLVQLIWPQDIQIKKHYRDPEGNEVVIWNNYFIDTMKALCEHRRVGLTGCASSGKTFCTSVYALLIWMSDPTRTTVMVSTTAGSDAERRVWGDIKDLHRTAKEVYPLGTLVDYLKVITFDPAKEFEGRKDVAERDIRNGLMVIAIPPGGEGDKALGKIIGTKNEKVVWIIDEMPHMIENILKPTANLEFNIWFQLVGIGNANRKSDPHGLFCEPTEGWDTISKDTHTEWKAGKTHVLFLHGQRSPNLHSSVSETLTDSEWDKRKLPFPWLSNRISMDMVAEEFGHGYAEEGRKTIEYMRFAIGFWYGDDISQTVLSAEFVREHGAEVVDVTWDYRSQTKVVGFDPGWTSGGDSCELMLGTIGFDQENSQILKVEPETIKIAVKADSRESFRSEVAKELVNKCLSYGVQPQDVFMDINGDGGLMALEINRVWSERADSPVSVNGLSSLEASDDNRYANIVTQYWYQVVRAIATDRVRGFNIVSGYAKDLFSRLYASVGKGVIQVERKTEMKKRIKRSPDRGDAFCYMIEGAKKRGFSFVVEKETGPRIHRSAIVEGYFPDPQSTENGDFETVGHGEQSDNQDFVTLGYHG